MRIFPHLRPGFTDVFLVSSPSLTGESSLSSLTPSIPLFRSRRFNPGFSTQFGALHGGLYAPARLTRHIRYTHPLTLSFSFSASLPRVLPTLRARRHIHIHSNPPISRIASSCFHPARPSFSRKRRSLHAVYPLFPFSFYPFHPPISLFLSLSLLLSSFFLNVSISPSFFLPLSHRFYLREQPPPPLVLVPALPHCPEREHLPTLLMFPLSVSPSPLLLPTQTASSLPPTSLFHPLLQQHYLDPTYVFHPPSPVFEWN